MARPKKQTVDYFPHYCNHKKTMFILEQRYGNDGYAFWFKLLETLGNNEGHYIDLRNDADKEFLASLTRLTGETCEEMLDLLSKLDAIDAELWEQKIVWSQNFVDGVKDVYRNRIVGMPERPSFLLGKHHIGGVSDVRNPQTKVNETKVNETKEEGQQTPENITTEEREILSTLKTIPNYPLDYLKDIDLLRQLSVEFPTIDIREEIKRFAVYKMDKPLTKKSNPRLQIRNWIEKAEEFKKERSANDGSNKRYSPGSDPAGKYRRFVKS